MHVCSSQLGPDLRGRRHALHRELFAEADAVAGDGIHTRHHLRRRQRRVFNDWSQHEQDVPKRELLCSSLTVARMFTSTR